MPRFSCYALLCQVLFVRLYYKDGDDDDEDAYNNNNNMLCYVIWLFVKRLSQEAIQRRSQRDRLVKIKVFKLRRDADDIPCNITLRSAGGESFHSAGPTTAKARFWDREVRDQG